MKRHWMTVVFVAAAAIWLAGCVRGRDADQAMVPAPSRGELQAMDSMFRSMMDMAKQSPEWLRLETHGDLIYVRPRNPERALVDYPEEALDRIDRMTVEGEVEAIGLKRYIRAQSMTFDRSQGRLGFEKARFLPNRAYVGQ